MPTSKDKGDMTVREAGQKGGEKVSHERGREFYEEIGRKGGEKVAAELRKIWGAPDLKVSATAVRVPTIRGHALAAWLTLSAGRAAASNGTVCTPRNRATRAWVSRCGEKAKIGIEERMRDMISGV